MELNYEENKNALDKYISECRNKIMNTFFSEDELKKGIPIKNSLINNGYSKSISLEEAIKQHRLNMIKIKINHTMRVVEDVTKMANQMGTNIDFTKVLKISALIHDIGRFEQATWSNDYADKNYANRNIRGVINHAEAGYYILVKENKIKDFRIPYNVQKPILDVVRYHQMPKLTDDLSYRVSSIKELNNQMNALLKANPLNDSEKIISSALVQMVKDVDSLDILYQHLTGEFNVTRDSIAYDVEGEDIDAISLHWGIPKEEILEYNGVEEKEVINMDSIRIPMKNVDPIKLTVPKDIQDAYFSKQDIDLKTIMNRRDCTFITGMWWRLNHFLRNINFVSNLMVVEDNKLLDKIYETYPDKYKPLVHDAFEFAKEELLQKAIKENEGEIYKKL